MATTLIDIVVRAKNQASQALRTPIKDLGDLRGAMKGMAGPMAAAGTAIAGAFLVAAKASAEYADFVQKASQKTGTTTEEFSRLAYAAKLSGVETETLQTAMRNLGNRAVDAANGTGEARKAYDALGISVKNQDGTLKGNNQLMAEVAEKLAGVKDGTTKAALASMIFGERIGTDMIPMLNGGAEGLRKMGIESDRFGQTIRGGAAADLEAVNDNFTRFQSILSGFVNTIVQAVAPAIRYMTDWILQSDDAMSGLTFWMKTFGNIAVFVAKTVGTAFMLVAQIFKAIGQAIGDTMAVIFQMITGDFRGAIETWKASNKDALNNVTETFAEIGELWKGKAKEDGEIAAKNLSEPIIKANKDIKKAAAETKKDDGATAKAAGKAMEASQKRAQEDAKIKADLERQKVAAVGDAYTQIAGLAESSNSTLSAIGKAAAIRNALMDAYAAINKTMASVPFPLNLIAAGAVGASAFANVNAIRGVAHGGLDYVPREGTYLLDEGERVLSPSENQAYSGVGATMVQLVVDSRVVAKGFMDLQRKGLIRVALA